MYHRRGIIIFIVLSFFSVGLNATASCPSSPSEVNQSDLIKSAWDSYSGSCACGERFENNCAHYLSNALIKAGCCSIDGGSGGLFRKESGYIVCKSGRPVRAKELRNMFFSKKWTRHSKPRDGYNLVYQEKADGRGHVLIKKYSGGRKVGHKGTGDYPDWPIQEFYY